MENEAVRAFFVFFKTIILYLMYVFTNKTATIFFISHSLSPCLSVCFPVCLLSPPPFSDSRHSPAPG